MSSKPKQVLERAVASYRREAVRTGSWLLRDAIAVLEAVGRIAAKADASAARRLAHLAHAWMGKNGGYIEFPATRRHGLDLLRQCLAFEKRNLKGARMAVREACEWTGVPIPEPRARERIARKVSAEWEHRNARDPEVAARIVLKAIGDPQADNAYKAHLMRVKRKKPPTRSTGNKK